MACAGFNADRAYALVTLVYGCAQGGLDEQRELLRLPRLALRFLFLISGMTALATSSSASQM